MVVSPLTVGPSGALFFVRPSQSVKVSSVYTTSLLFQSNAFYTNRITLPTNLIIFIFILLACSKTLISYIRKSKMISKFSVTSRYHMPSKTILNTPIVSPNAS